MGGYEDGSGGRDAVSDRPGSQSPHREAMVQPKQSSPVNTRSSAKAELPTLGLPSVAGDGLHRGGARPILYRPAATPQDTGDPPV